MNMDCFEGMDSTGRTYQEFINNWIKTDCKKSNYLDFCGSGSTHKAKVEGRVNTINEYLQNFVAKQN